MGLYCVASLLTISLATVASQLNTLRVPPGALVEVGMDSCPISCIFY